MRKIIIIFVSILAIITISIGSYGIFLYRSVVETIAEIHEPIVRENMMKKRKEEVSIERSEPLSFLLLGIDAYETDRGRSDTIIVVTANPNTNSIQMMSIPRDTKVTIVGRGTEDKINHAYAFGGATMAIETVEELLDIPIDFFVSVNMTSFKEIVDALGGVTVKNRFEFDSFGYFFPEGEITLDGEWALVYSRMRYNDPRGDHGRNDRQRDLVMAIIDQAAQFSTITKLTEILNSVGSNVRTDATLDQMIKIQSNYKEARHHLETLTLDGNGQIINGVWYYIVSEEEIQRVSRIVKEHLELP